MTPTEPLPRSLIPLPGESLRGLVLRLSHRLGQSPGHILWRTGLGTEGRWQPSRAPRRLLIMLELDELQRFAATTRLDPQAVDRLTLRSCFAASPSVTRDLAHPGQPLRLPNLLPAWLLFSNPRYCPLCLAGDGSEIQRRHAGTWKLQWHLPIVFACLEHQVFLQHHCPACQQADGIPVRLAPTFITNATTAGLHPAQCRNKITNDLRGSLCGSRLDSPYATDLALTPALEELQRELLGVLDDTTGPAQTLRHLAHLRVLSAIISATWPNSLRGSLPGPLADTLNSTLHRPVQAAPEARNQLQRWDTAPVSAPASAAVLSIAMHFLKLPLPKLRTELHALAEDAPSNLDPSWGSTWNLLIGDFSPALRIEIKQAFTRPSPKPSLEPSPMEDLKGRARRSYLRRALPVLTRRHSYRPEHIPQHLPEDWLHVLVEASTPNHLPRSLRFRRAAAVQLVQIASGMSITEAAAFLQIPDAWLNSTHPQVAPLTRHVLSSNFNVSVAFETLVAHIARTPDLVDYRERRERFHSWCLSQDRWKTLISALPGRPSTWPDAKRRAYSAVIWAHLTGSEWRLAPDADPLPLTSEGKRQIRHTPMELTLVELKAKWSHSRATQTVLADYAASLILAGSSEPAQDG
ncbi:TniQ family protein [Streptomyces prunicolor]|uniref:TniQ family protein n=1 Tax=Streptomyces prunicolor TaxID=67348 RepID=UPI003714C9D6